MEVIFLDKKLELILTDDAIKLKLPINVINSVRKKLTLLASATDERDLRNWKSLHYEKLTGNLDGYKSIRINNQWRLVFELDTGVSPPKICIKSIEDYH
jgi:proteic killer suppression protein